MKLLINILRALAGLVDYLKLQWRRAKTTPGANANRDRFRAASRYASRQMKDLASRTEYEKGITRKKPSAYQVAFTDYLTRPEVHSIYTPKYTGKKGDVLEIHASDDFMVERVSVSIIASNGRTLEEGQAVKDPEWEDYWNYTAKAFNPKREGTAIRATAFDKAGNWCTLEVMIVQPYSKVKHHESKQL
jgi:hypothetical protein